MRVGQLYDIERQAHDVSTDERLRIRPQQSRPIVDKRHDWLVQHRAQVPQGSATAKAIDYSLRRGLALSRVLGNGHIPIDNNWVDNRMRPIARDASTGCLPVHSEQASAQPPS